MKLSSGKVAFPIEFDDGEVRNIYFNPTDPNLAVRMRNFKDNISKRISEYSEMKLTSAGTPVNLSEIEKFIAAQEILKEELDYAFGGEIYDVVFKDLSPFALIDGKFLFESFIEGIAPEIEVYVKKARMEMSDKMSSYTKKYGK